VVCCVCHPAKATKRTKKNQHQESKSSLNHPKSTKKIMKVNNNNKTAKCSMSSIKRSIQMSNKKASGDGWLGCIEKGIRTPPNFIVGVKRVNDTPTTVTNLSHLSQEQSQSSKSKTPTASQQKRWAVYNDMGSPDVTVNDGRKNLQQYQSLSPCAWTSKYDSPITDGQPSGEPLSETNSPPLLKILCLWMKQKYRHLMYFFLKRIRQKKAIYFNLR
jgi:hypothetical protein